MSTLHAPRTQAEHLPCWGKAAVTPVPVPGAATWHRLAHHSLDVAAVGAALPARLPALRQLFSARLGLPDHLLDSWLSFCLALHDLGKFSEAFQSQRPDLFSNLRGRAPSRARPYTLRHDSPGMLFWTEVVKEQLINGAWFGAHSEDLADGIDCWMRACTGHHGQPPSSGDTWTQHFHVTEDRAAALALVGWARCVLPAPPGTPRSFLFRRRDVDGLPRFYVVSDREPAASSAHWHVTTKPYAAALAMGARLAFELKANPVVTTRNAQGKPVRHDVVMQEKTGLLQERAWPGGPTGVPPTGRRCLKSSSAPVRPGCRPAARG